MRILLTTVLLVFWSNANCQNTEDHWEAYMAQYPDGVGSTTVNMTLKAKAPLPQYPYLLVTGVGFRNCKDGFPANDELEKLYAITDSVESLLGRIAGNLQSAGSFMQNCERVNYFYLADTTGLRTQLAAMFTKRFPAYAAVIRMRADKAWDAYQNFLYPNEETLEYIRNSKVVLKLQEAGDKLNKPRTIDHWLYFKTDKGRQQFIAYAVANGYKVESKKTVAGSNESFQLHLLQTGMADINSITQTTVRLKKEARKFGGVYDGWESVVVRQ